MNLGQEIAAIKERNRAHFLSTLSIPLVKRWWANFHEEK